jgi:capsular polysaccharide biosynthesis protein
MLFTRYGDALRRHWHLAAVLSALGALLLGFVAWRQPPLYRADLRLLVTFGAQTDPVGSPPGAVTADTDAGRRLMASRVRGYTQKAGSRAVLRAVIVSLRLPYRPDDLAGRVLASTPLDTRFIDISVLDADPRRAVAVGDAIAAELGGIATAETSAAPSAPLMISVDRPPTVLAGPIRRPWPAYALGGLLGGFVMGVGFATLRTELAAGRAKRVPVGTRTHGG